MVEMVVQLEPFYVVAPIYHEVVVIGSGSTLKTDSFFRTCAPQTHQHRIVGKGYGCPALNEPNIFMQCSVRIASFLMSKTLGLQ